MDWNKDKKNLLKFLIIIFLILLIHIFFLFSNSLKTYFLQKNTFEELIKCANNISPENINYSNEHILDILKNYELEKIKIDEKYFNGGITGLLITVLIILTSIKRIIRSVKGIISEFNGKNTTDDGSNQMNRSEYDKYMKKLSEYQQLRDRLEQLNKLREYDKSKGQDETMKLIERMMMNLLEEFVVTLGHTSNYTKEIDNNKEQLMAGMSEIRKGMEQIALVMANEKYKDDKLSTSELMAALQQIDTAIEENGLLILEMDKKIRALSSHVEQFKNGNDSKCK